MLLTVSQGSWFWMSARSISLPELLPWVSWCYSHHPLLWHTSGVLHSEDGVQQGDPLGPLLFALVLHKLVMKLDAELGADLLLKMCGSWMMVFCVAHVK